MGHSQKYSIAMIRYRLRTLLIVLALGPPILAPLLAPVLSFLFENPWARQAALIAGVLIAGFAIFWLVCGLVWLVIMRAFERLLGERRS